jgi:hypothetical protein
MEKEDTEELCPGKFVFSSEYSLLHEQNQAGRRQTNLDRLVFLVQKTIMLFKMASVFCFIIPVNSSVNIIVNRRYEY